MSAVQFIKELNRIITKFEGTQLDAVEEAAVWVADAVQAERFGVLFGTGHSYMAASDTFPRIGSIPAWLPIHELSTSYIGTVSGNLGIRQAIFLEKVDGFGDVVMENYRLDPKDVMIVISNSGVNTMGVEVALNAKGQGMKTVAVTSVEHSQGSDSRHKSGKRLFEVCDLVIDTCVPEGDALVEIDGFSHKVSSASSIMALIVMQTLAAQVVKELSERGITLPVFPSHNASLSPEEHERIEKMAEDTINEYIRRTANIYK
jgi:uncharacterized phosphosugar-binding protein